MNTLRSEVLDLPVQDRLEHALYPLDEITGQDFEVFGWLKQKWGLTPEEPRVFYVLNINAPRILTKNAIMAALINPDLSIKIVDVYICKLRKKTDVPIITIWGVGYQILEPIELPKGESMITSLRSRRREKWSTMQDHDLRVMWENGSHLEVIAEEFERSEHGIIERAKALGLKSR